MLNSVLLSSLGFNGIFRLLPNYLGAVVVVININIFLIQYMKKKYVNLIDALRREELIIFTHTSAEQTVL